jgi:glycerol kinase
VLEATGWQTREVVDAMNADSGVPVTRLKADGGMTANHLLMQFVADVLDVPVERPLGSEAVSLGAAYAAGLAVGYWSGVEVIRANWHRAAAWEPAMDPSRRRVEHANWLRAVDRSYNWVQPSGSQ